MSIPEGVTSNHNIELRQLGEQEHAELASRTIHDAELLSDETGHDRAHFNEFGRLVITKAQNDRLHYQGIVAERREAFNETNEYQEISGHIETLRMIAAGLSERYIQGSKWQKLHSQHYTHPDYNNADLDEQAATDYLWANNIPYTLTVLKDKGRDREKVGESAARIYRSLEERCNRLKDAIALLAERPDIRYGAEVRTTAWVRFADEPKKIEHGWVVTGFLADGSIKLEKFMNNRVCTRSSSISEIFRLNPPTKDAHQ